MVDKGANHHRLTRSKRATGFYPRRGPSAESRLNSADGLRITIALPTRQRWWEFH